MAEEKKLGRMNPKRSVFNKFWKNFERVNAWIYAIGALIILLLAGITLLDVGGRYFFSKTLPGALELSELAMCTIIFLCFGYSFTLKAHIDIDLVTSRLPKRLQAVLEIMIHILTLFLLIVIVSQSARIAIEQKGNYTDILEIQTFFFTMLIPIGSAIAAISMIGHLVKNIFSTIKDKG
jgi:TRAP-type C4-dicarboxylate transport system permease small subunit